MLIGPQTEPADRLHATKYRAPGEDYRECINRLAFGLKENDNHYHQIKDIAGPMRFIFAGRIQSAIGSSKWTTAYNCFVSGTIADSFVDGPGSIMQRATEAAATMRMGGGIGYDFSTLRPRGELIAKLMSSASGLVPFMDIFDAVCRATASAGNRRGAQMGIVRVDHPDTEEFLHAKNNRDKLTGFNISIAITHEFMEAVIGGKEFDLRWGGKVYRTIDAVSLWENIMRSTFDWAEPGVVFIDTINDYNNLWYCETIATTNPCSEQPLPPFGACLLGSFNLVKYLINSFGIYHFDFDLLAADISPIVRAMDNVVDRARYPLAEQRAEALTKRRMGLGIMGLANTAEALGYPYGSQKFLEFEEKVLETINVGAYTASAYLAVEKGAFPLFDEQRYMRGKFIKTLPEETRELIKRHGIRNSHLTSIAPTGTISLTADNVSSGIEPVFSYSMDRPINTPDGQVIERIEDYGSAFLGVRGKLASQVTAAEHLSVLTTAQRYVDSAVSKTINMDGRIMPWEDFKAIYQNAWEQGAKGCATFNIAGKRGALLVAADEPQLTCEIDQFGRRSCE